ncbi:Splicing factor arginine:serine rich [Fasciolopsis buskii]|uniref:Splicing factor arginine:serine rich n=1 Tax=Fasciolopsis buskii TaxID=27845 RepID=A0A8E0RLU3_9TREM|nr:Splicing factor arginine:serine rich [Fasciolopsis buski]
MAVSVRSRIVQVTNISPSATTEQLRTLFGHVGVLEEFVMYPPDDKEEPASKVAFVRYLEPINAEVALHLNNTVFLDRALIVLPLANGLDSIPDEKYADLVRAPPHTAAGVLPRTADWPLDVISMVVGRPGEQVIQTIEPRLSSLAFPLYPPLPATTDGSRIEEIRRTILVTNLDPKTTGDQVLEFFNNNAEVRCVRMAGTEADRAAYVEFTQQPSIVKAFGLMGVTLNGRQIMVQHSNCAIIKPANNFALYDDTAKLAGSNGAKAIERRKCILIANSHRYCPWVI